MHYLAHQLIVSRLLLLSMQHLWLRVPHSHNIVCNLFKTPPGKYHLMTPLRVSTNHSIYYPSMTVEYLHLLKVLTKATAIQYSLLSNFSYKTFLVSDFYCRSVLWTETTISFSYSFVRHMLIIVLSKYLPGTMRSWQQNSHQQRCTFFKSQVDVSLFFIRLVSWCKLILIR